MKVLTAEGFAQVQRETLESQIQVFPARSWWPSTAASPCDRMLVWNWTKFEQKQRHDYVLESIFRAGDELSPYIYARLEKMGFEVVREHDRPIQHKLHGGGVISGRPDGKLRGFKGQRFAQPWVLELKSMHEHAWQQINTIEDIKNHKSWYVRGYFDQLNLYEFLEELEHGCLVLMSKSTHLLKFVPAALDYEAAERSLIRFERLQPMIAREEDPPPIPYEESVCGRCAFSHLCWPPKDMGAGVVPLEDEGILQLLEEREETAAAAKLNAAADKAVKAHLKRLGPFEAAIAGRFLIERTEVAVRGYTVQPRTDVRFNIAPIDAPKQITED